MAAPGRSPPPSSQGSTGGMPAWPTRRAASTHLGLLVVLVLDAVDLLQQVANPVHLQGRAASGHLPHQGLLCIPQPDTPSQGPASVPGGRHGRLLCPTAHPQGAGTAGGWRAKCPQETKTLGSARSRPARRTWSQALLGPVTAPSAHLIRPNPTGEQLRTLPSTPCPHHTDQSQALS